MFSNRKGKFSMHSGQFVLCLAAASLGWSTTAQAKATITTIDPPNSAETHPTDINNDVITGYYFDDSGSGQHGFVRTANGTYTTFDPPNSDGGTFAKRISSTGAITGYSVDSSGVEHGYVRADEGTITVFDVDGSASTEAWGVNKRGAITGIYYDINNGVHGFARTPQGKITTFDPPGSTKTSAQRINTHGVILGTYVDSGGVQHGYLRTADGMITAFDPPDSIETHVNYISNKGVISGTYYDTNSNLLSYIRTADGAFTMIDPGCGGRISSMDNKNHFTGLCDSGDSYEWRLGGKLHTFSAPGSEGGTFSNSIDDAGNITGNYHDVNSIIHGFLRSH